jgi:hypothetical protein
MASLKDLALKIIIGGEDKSGPSLSTARKNVESLGESVGKVKAQIVGFAQAYLSLSGIKGGFGLVDTYNELQAKIRQVVGESGNLAAVQDRLFKIAQATASPIRDTVDLYARASEALKRVADGQELAAKLTETVNLSFKAQSTGTSEMSSTVSQLTQSIGTGTVTWEDFGNVAQSNLLLANTAAKNLGYDGISGLKQAISESKVTGEQMTRALVAGFDEIKARADQMPVGVSRSMVLINNALIQFAGESNTANTAARTFSETLQFIAEHINELANIGLIVAEAYAIKVVGGMIASGKAMLQASEAANVKAAADAMANKEALALLTTEIALAKARQTAALTSIEAARVQLSLANSAEKTAAANKRLQASIASLHQAQATAAAKQSALNAALGGADTSATLATRAVNLLGLAVRALMVIPLVTTVADWLLKLDVFYVSAMRVQEALALLLTGAKAMFDGDSLSQRWEQVKAIHAEYNELIAKNSNSSKQAAAETKQAEDEKTKAVEEATQKQAAAFKQVQEAPKALTAQIDADAKQQTQAIQQALAERLIAIDGSNQLDAQKDAQRLQARLLAGQQELQLQQTVSASKLQLIDAEYAGEYERAQGNADRLKEIEKSKHQAKLSVYQGVADFYVGEVQRLTEVYGQETAAFAQSKQAIESLSASHQQRLLDLERQGMTERQKAASEELEFNTTLAALKAELAKGDAASQNTINELMTRAKTLQNDITQAAINSADTQAKKSSAVYEAKKREIVLYSLEKGILETNAKAHQDNAQKVQAALESNQQKLEEAKSSITEISDLLAKEYALIINIDQDSLSAAQRKIADLTKPETKTITIQTVKAGGGAAPGQSTGGPAGKPTGQPWRFAQGGWARMAGLLSGYGGGDKRKALLEDGEYIVRKEAVKKLGVDTLDAINDGELPLQRSSGGSIGDILQEEQKKLALEQIKKLLAKAPGEAVNRFFGFGAVGDKQDFRASTRNNALASNRLAKDNLSKKLQPLLAKLGVDEQSQVMQAIANLPKARPLNRRELVGAGNDKFFSNNPLNQQTKEQSLNENLVFNALIKNLGTQSDKKQAFNLPSIPTLGDSAATVAAPSKTVTVQFKAPDGSGGVSAAFNSDTDVSKMLDMISVLLVRRFSGH